MTNSIEIWDAVHRDRQWGTCPEPAVARWAMRRWGGLDKDAKGKVKLLEVGCGVGAMAFWLVNSGGFLVDAVDSSGHAIDRAQALHGFVYPHSLHFGVGDASNLTPVKVADAVNLTAMPLRPESYDGVVDVCCLQHVDNIQGALSSIAYMLKPGGRLFSIIAAADHTDLMGNPGDPLHGAMFHRLSMVKVVNLFGSYFTGDLSIETSNHTDRGSRISHWVIEATKK